MIRLETITPENWRVDLAVSANQLSFVAPRERILARAYAYRAEHSRAFIIFHDDIPIGMVLYYDYPKGQTYELSQFFIDERYQGRGYGYEAMLQVFDVMLADGRYQQVRLCYTADNPAARRFYDSLGFQVTSEGDDEEIVMVRPLS
ncbi:diamine N-acetyltransferase [Streptococcus rupicaprae]|uniref:Diamine N-acetyltransferase n=1 Tax=Streptococcus rupicaprae TaxID=759619 RepID=A0ABV2FHI2_9STRE